MSVRQSLGIAARRKEVPGPILEAAFAEIMDGAAEPIAAAGLLAALRTKGESAAEIVAAARAMRARAETAPLPDPRAIDTCGTGGDGLGTFNISTAAAFVAAGAGVPVAKHGNRGASNPNGSFDVLVALGVEADVPIPRAAALVRELGIGFLYARRAHPAMRHLAPIRSALGLRTIMNCVGPLLNPVGVRRQLVGVYDEAMLAPLAEALGGLGAERALIVHGAEGLDELSTAGPSRVARLEGGTVALDRVDPAELGLAPAPAASLAGGSAADNARILRAVLRGEAGPRRDIVVLNAAAALWVAGRVEEVRAGLSLARQSLDSGAALARLEALVAASPVAAP